MRNHLSIFLSLVSVLAVAQEPDTILVSDQTTLYILFDSPVTFVEPGAKDDYGFDAMENIAKIIALRPNARTTSLMITTTTEIRVWVLKYSQQAKILEDTRSQKPRPTEKPVTPQKQGMQTASINESILAPTTTSQRTSLINVQSTKLASHPIVKARIDLGNRDSDVLDDGAANRFYGIFNSIREYKGLGEIDNGLTFTCENIFVDKKFIYFKVNLHNTSSIAFDIDLISFERISAKSILKRDAKNPEFIPPTFHEAVVSIQPGKNESMVYAIPLFAPSKGEELKIRINERSGRRTSEIYIPIKLILNAKSADTL